MANFKVCDALSLNVMPSCQAVHESVPEDSTDCTVMGADKVLLELEFD